MSSLGVPKGLFSLSDSNHCVGSLISRQDLEAMRFVPQGFIDSLEFNPHCGVDVIDERRVQKVWYASEEVRGNRTKISFDEVLLLNIIERALPGCELNRQVRVGRFLVDLQIVYNGKTIFVEFDGPSHFAVTRFGPPKHGLFRKKRIVEDATGIELVNWPYWIQRCEKNVKVLFGLSVVGQGVIWSATLHFGDFYFDDSADVIGRINNRFHADRKEGIGYFYEGCSEGRNNPEHPVVNNIIFGKEKTTRLIPKGSKDSSYWLPKSLW